MKTVGILGGMGPLATVDLFQKIVQNTSVTSDQNHLPIVTYNNPKIPSRVEAILENGESPLPELIQSAKVLENSGVDFIVIPCNTAHFWIKNLQDEVHIPIYNMVEQTVLFIRNYYPEIGNNILLFATKATALVGLYQKAFREQGLSLQVPNVQEQEEIALAINEVKAGKIQQNKYLHSLEKIIEGYQLESVSAVLGGCTEIPLLFPYIKKDVMKIDPTLILANFVVNHVKNNHSP